MFDKLLGLNFASLSLYNLKIFLRKRKGNNNMVIDIPYYEMEAFPKIKQFIYLYCTI